MIPKYRAWDTTNKEMFKDTFAITESGQVVVVEQDFVTDIPDYVFVDNLVVMQSTGLKDKNGKEIFEGDVVTNGWKRQVVTFGTQEVEEDFGSIRIYRGFNLYLGGGYPNAIMSEFEVVGNIYENPDLLEVIK